MKTIILISSVLVLISGCASKTINKVSGITQGDEICVIRNNAVRADFLIAYIESLEKIGYQAVIKKTDDATCPITSTYYAKYGIHMGAYLAVAELRIFRDDNVIGSAFYREPRSDPSKHGRVANKIDVLVEEMFAN